VLHQVVIFQIEFRETVVGKVEPEQAAGVDDVDRCEAVSGCLDACERVLLISATLYAGQIERGETVVGQVERCETAVV